MLKTFPSVAHNGTISTQMSNVQCLGTESRLTECPHSAGGNGSAASLTCFIHHSGKEILAT